MQQYGYFYFLSYLHFRIFLIGKPIPFHHGSQETPCFTPPGYFGKIGPNERVCGETINLASVCFVGNAFLRIQFFLVARPRSGDESPEWEVFPGTIEKNHPTC